MFKKLFAGSLALVMACATPVLAAPMHGGGGGGGFHGGGGGFHGGGARGFGGGGGRGFGGGGGYGRGYGRGGYAPYLYGGLAAGALIGGGYLYNRYEDGYYGYPSSLQGGSYDDQCSRSDRYRAQNGNWYYCD